MAEPLTGPEQLFWAEVQSSSATRHSLALCYALLIAAGAGPSGDFWRPINDAMDRWLATEAGVTGTGLTATQLRDQRIARADVFRREAWAVHHAAASVRERPKEARHA